MKLFILSSFPDGATFAFVWYFDHVYGVFSGGGKSHVFLRQSSQHLRAMTMRARASPARDALTL